MKSIMQSMQFCLYFHIFFCIFRYLLFFYMYTLFYYVCFRKFSSPFSSHFKLKWLRSSRIIETSLMLFIKKIAYNFLNLISEGLERAISDFSEIQGIFSFFSKLNFKFNLHGITLCWNSEFLNLTFLTFFEFFFS